MRSILIASAILALVGCANSGTGSIPKPPPQTMQVDLQRYQGTWYELARLPMFFQRNCVANVTATYTSRADGKVGVRNACDDKDGETMVSEGVARPVAGQPGRLEVRFAPDWLAWAPMTWADYWVVELDPDYQWAVVGGPSRKYLWVLSRTPTMPRVQFDAIRERALRRGYPVDRLLISSNGVSSD